MKRAGSWVAVALCAVFLTGAPATETAFAQTPNARSPSAAQPLPEPTNSRRRGATDAARDIEREAAKQYGRGTPEYIAAIRLGNSQISTDDTFDTQNEPSVRTPRAQALVRRQAPQVTALDGDPNILQLARVPGWSLYIWQGEPDQEFNETVAIIKGKRIACSGTLIGRGIVLTAAHCLCHRDSDTGQTVRVDALDIQVAFGPNAQERFPADILDAWSCPNQNGRDLAMVFFSDPRERARTIARLPIDIRTYFDRVNAYFQQNSISPDRGFFIAGYGVTEVGTRGQRRKVQIPVVTGNCARPIDPGQYSCEPGLDAVFADGAGGDSCNGDSGGPVFAVGFGDRVLTAVVSRGVIPGSSIESCGHGGVYTLLGYDARQWIDATIARQRRTQ